MSSVNSELDPSLAHSEARIIQEVDVISDFGGHNFRLSLCFPMQLAVHWNVWVWWYWLEVNV